MSRWVEVTYGPVKGEHLAAGPAKVVEVDVEGVHDGGELLLAAVDEVVELGVRQGGEVGVGVLGEEVADPLLAEGHEVRDAIAAATASAAVVVPVLGAGGADEGEETYGVGSAGCEVRCG